MAVWPKGSAEPDTVPYLSASDSPALPSRHTPHRRRRDYQRGIALVSNQPPLPGVLGAKCCHLPSHSFTGRASHLHSTSWPVSKSPSPSIVISASSAIVRVSESCNQTLMPLYGSQLELYRDNRRRPVRRLSCSLTSPPMPSTARSPAMPHGPAASTRTTARRTHRTIPRGERTTRTAPSPRCSAAPAVRTIRRDSCGLPRQLPPCSRGRRRVPP